MTEKRPSRIKNLTIAGILALTGFIALFVALLALFIGLWLDTLIGVRGLATVCLLALSVPVSLFIMVRLALSLVSRIDFEASATVASGDAYVSSAVKEDESFD